MELMTVKEAAELLRVTPITVRRYIADGRLPAVRVGKGVRVQKEAIEQFPKPLQPKGRARKSAVRRGKPFTMNDPLWNLAGIGHSSEGPGDVSANKYKYLAKAYLPKKA